MRRVIITKMTLKVKKFSRASREMGGVAILAQGSSVGRDSSRLLPRVLSYHELRPLGNKGKTWWIAV